jgi:hypothetical protein
MTAGAFVRSRTSLNATGNRMFVNAARSPDETQTRNPLGVTQPGSWGRGVRAEFSPGIILPVILP